MYSFSPIKPHKANHLPKTLGKPLTIPIRSTPINSLARILNKGPALDSMERRISIAGKSKSLGLFNTAEEASTAYENAAKKNFGEFYCKNK